MKFEYKKIDTVIFDVGGVLTTFPNDDFFRRKGFSKEMEEKLIKITFTEDIWGELDRGVLFRKDIIRILSKLHPEYEKDIHVLLSDLTDIVSRKDTSIPWIKSVKQRGYKAYVLSNYGKESMDASKNAMDFVPYLDGCFWSYQYKMIKPEPEIYETFLKKFNVDPLKAVFIDDMPRNLEAAEKFGIRTILCTSYEQASADLNKLLSKS